MELDTGSAVSIISVLDYKKYLENEKLESAKITLKTYSTFGVIQIESCAFLFFTQLIPK
jgi:hypothetical protein